MSMKKGAIVFFLLTVMSLAAAVFGGVTYFTEKHKYDEFVDSCTAVIDGKVISCESFYRGSYTRGGGHNRSEPHSHRDNTYYNIVVGFTVNNVDYTSSFEQTTDMAVDTVVQVHYCPERPTDNYTGDEPDKTYDETLFVLGIVASVVFGAVSVLMLKNIRSSPY